jgi:hypothetical protein
MRVTLWLFVLAVVMLLYGCGEPEAATAEEGFHHVMVETPGDAMVIV